MDEVGLFDAVKSQLFCGTARVCLCFTVTAVVDVVIGSGDNCVRHLINRCELLKIACYIKLNSGFGNNTAWIAQKNIQGPVAVKQCVVRNDIGNKKSESFFGSVC